MPTFCETSWIQKQKHISYCQSFHKYSVHLSCHSCRPTRVEQRSNIWTISSEGELWPLPPGIRYLKAADKISETDLGNEKLLPPSLGFSVFRSHVIDRPVIDRPCDWQACVDRQEAQIHRTNRQIWAGSILTSILSHAEAGSVNQKHIYQKLDEND